MNKGWFWKPTALIVAALSILVMVKLGLGDSEFKTPTNDSGIFLNIDFSSIAAY